MTATDPEVDLRARILEALNTAVVPELRDDPEALASHEQHPWRRHNRHKFHIWCALCQGEAETLADAVMAAIGPVPEPTYTVAAAPRRLHPEVGAAVTAWSPETLPPELAAILDRQAGKVHSPSGAVRSCLADILNAYDEMRERPDPAAEYGGDPTAPLCCCKRGLMCGACGTGEHWQCPDRDDWDDEADDDDEYEGCQDEDD